MKKGASAPFFINSVMKILDILAENQNRSIKSSTGNDIVAYFETSQGSKYLRTSAGETKRIKSLHANTGAGDVGVKPWYQHSIFIPAEFRYEGNAPLFMVDRVGGISNLGISLKGDQGVFYKLVDGKWEVCTWDDAYPKSNKGKKPLLFKYSDKPVKGYHVAEFNVKNNRLSNYHFGSEVSEIKPISDIPNDVLMQFSDKKKGS